MKNIKWGDNWEEFNLFQKLFGRNGIGLILLILLVMMLFDIL